MDTRGFGGKSLKKNIVVMTDDKAVSDYRLTVAGRVDKFVTMVPRVVRFRGNVNDSHKAIVRIVPEKKYPFEIIGVKALRGPHLAYHLEEGREQAEKAYVLHIENRKNDAGTYYDVVVLETDSNIQPELKINVMASLTDPAGVAGTGSVSGTDTRQSATGGPAPRAGGTGAEQQQTQPAHNAFLEMLKKMQQQKAEHTGTAGEAVSGDSEPAEREDMRKKFEELIKRAREQMDDAPGKASAPASDGE